MFNNRCCSQTGWIYPPVDALPQLTTGPYRASQHDAWDCPQLGAPLIAGYTGDEMGDPEPCRNKRCRPQRDSSRQPARTQRTSKDEEHKPNHRTGTSSGTSHRSPQLHYAAVVRATSAAKQSALGGGVRARASAWIDSAACTLRDCLWGIGWRFGHVYSLR